MTDLAKTIDEVRALRGDGHFDGALALLSQVLRTDPENARILYEIACTFDPQGKELDAIPFYERAIATGLAGLNQY